METKEFFYSYPSSKFGPKKLSELYVVTGLRDDVVDKKLRQKEYEFQIMREYFFERLLNKPQDQVVWEMVENNKQLIKGRRHELLF